MMQRSDKKWWIGGAALVVAIAVSTQHEARAGQATPEQQLSPSAWELVIGQEPVRDRGQRRGRRTAQPSTRAVDALTLSLDPRPLSPFQP